jgi:hypothetical protein
VTTPPHELYHSEVFGGEALAEQGAAAVGASPRPLVHKNQKFLWTRVANEVLAGRPKLRPVPRLQLYGHVAHNAVNLGAASTVVDPNRRTAIYELRAGDRPHHTLAVASMIQPLGGPIALGAKRLFLIVGLC